MSIILFIFAATFSQMPVVEQARDPGPILSRAIAMEQKRDSGTAILLVASDPEGDFKSLWPGSPEAAGKSVTLDVTWKGTDLFRIEVSQDGTHVRTIVCDGSSIDTGNGILWDKEILFDPSALGEERDIQFRELMWPYHLFRMYYFPLTHGIPQLGYQTFYFNQALRISKLDQSSSDVSPPEAIAHLVVGANRSGADENGIRWEYAIDQEHGHTLARYDEVLDDKIVESYEFSQPYAVSDSFWIPGEFTYTLHHANGDAVIKATSVKQDGSMSERLASTDFSLPQESYREIVLPRPPWRRHVDTAAEVVKEGVTLPSAFAVCGLLLILAFIVSAIYLVRRRGPSNSAGT